MCKSIEPYPTISTIDVVLKRRIIAVIPPGCKTQSKYCLTTLGWARDSDWCIAGKESSPKFQERNNTNMSCSNKVQLLPFQTKFCLFNHSHRGPAISINHQKWWKGKYFRWANVTIYHNIKHIFLRIPLPNQSGQQSYSFHVHPCSVPRCTELFIPYQHTSTKFSAP